MPASQAITIIIFISAAAAFGLVASLWFIGVALWQLRRNVKVKHMENRLRFEERLNPSSPRVLRLWREGNSLVTTVPGDSLYQRLRNQAVQLHRGLGWDIAVPTLVFGPAALMSGCFLVALLLTEDLVIGLLAGIVPLFVTMSVVKRRLRSQTALFEAQFVDALALATRSLRAGHPVLGAFRLIVEEMNPPISLIFGEIVQQQALGIGLDESLRTAAARSPSPDLKLFAAATIIQLDSGGNLADMMDRLAVVIRDRLRLHRRVRILTTQNEMSKKVLMFLPFLIFVGIYFLNRGYLEPLYLTSAGRIMLIIASVLLLVGWWLINRITILRY
ncbi:MAG: type II secretion system F family protein [Candidatus Hydrogenedentes bacterium]|nr:type II secretion system F family protein [Candidatus Hydrogenedentota bacterium]